MSFTSVPSLVLLHARPETCSVHARCFGDAFHSQRRTPPARLHLRRQRKQIRCADEDKTASVVVDDGPKRPSPLQGFKVKRVERLGGDSVAGVASIDRGDALQIGQLALLVSGDAAALLLFAAIGRRNHSEGLQLAGVVSTALPFLIGWYIAAVLTGAYKLPSQRERTVGRAISTAARAWLLAVPVALALRSAQRGYLPDKSFVIVSFVATGVLLVGWRAALAAATQGKQQGSQNRQGNPFEFLQLLASLTKRW